MTDRESAATPADPGVWVARRDEELRARFEHLQALNSAWSVLVFVRGPW